LKLHSTDSLKLKGNLTGLSILIRNLVDNAIRYTPEHGQVTIDITKTSRHVILKVIDTGPGIPEELRSRVFERFYRMIGNNAAGSGLGLAIVQQIAALHHAEIKLATPRNGKGLQIEIWFPKR
jgi:two-component system sensor histidine kinase QseC